jgi:hypothetical protein
MREGFKKKEQDKQRNCTKEINWKKLTENKGENKLRRKLRGKNIYDKPRK